MKFDIDLKEKARKLNEKSARELAKTMSFVSNESRKIADGAQKIAEDPEALDKAVSKSKEIFNQFALTVKKASQNPAEFLDKIILGEPREPNEYDAFFNRNDLNAVDVRSKLIEIFHSGTAAELTKFLESFSNNANNPELISQDLIDTTVTILSRKASSTGPDNESAFIQANSLLQNLAPTYFKRGEKTSGWFERLQRIYPDANTPEKRTSLLKTSEAFIEACPELITKAFVDTIKKIADSSSNRGLAGAACSILDTVRLKRSKWQPTNPLEGLHK
jgi:hypothetical protein